MPFKPNDAIARKYCFKASVKIVNKVRVPVGVFIGYDTKPTIASEVEKIGQDFCLEKGNDEYECASVELFLHKECPVELTNEIYFQPFEAFDR